MHILFWWGILKETDRFEDVDVYDNIQMDIKKWGGCCLLCQFGQNGDELWVAVKAVMNFAFHRMEGIC